MSEDIHTVQAILTTKEAAALLRISDKTLRDLSAKGQLPGFRVGRQWRFRRDDLDRVMRGQ